MIPSGYKNQKVYSAVPTDGLGDLTFSRASSATRVASNGLIEKVRTNLTKNSQTGASWTAGGSTVDSTSVADFFGGTAAVQFTANGGVAANVFADNTISITSGTPYAASVYVKDVDANYVQLTFSTATFGSGQYRNFDLTTGTLGGGIGLLDSKIENVGGGWFRISIAATATNTAATGAIVLGIVPSASASRLQAATAGQTLIAFAIQFETGDIATDYIATTTAAVSVGPVSGLPRLDYLGSTCPRLLLEPQRTNLVQYSEQFNNAYWTKQNGSITSNTEVAPDGTTTADTLTSNGGSATANKSCVSRTSVTAADDNIYTRSIFLKKGNTRYAWLSALGASFVNDFSAIFDFDDEVITFENGIENIKTEKLINGWYRLSFSRVSTSNTNRNFSVGMTNSPTTFSNHNSGDFVHIWGAQLEAGAYATSYIPTLGASVTRVADAAILNNSAALPTAYPFTLFGEVDLVDPSGSGEVVSFLNAASSNNYFALIYYSNKWVIASRPNGATSLLETTTVPTAGRHKVAGIFTSTELKIFVDGVLIGTGTNAQTFNAAINDLLVGQLRQISDAGIRMSARQSLVFNSALTDQQAIELTA
jgi:hypothetical protein